MTHTDNHSFSPATASSGSRGTRTVISMSCANICDSPDGRKTESLACDNLACSCWAATADRLNPGLVLAERRRIRRVATIVAEGPATTYTSVKSTSTATYPRFYGRSLPSDTLTVTAETLTGIVITDDRDVIPETSSLICDGVYPKVESRQESAAWLLSRRSLAAGSALTIRTV